MKVLQSSAECLPAGGISVCYGEFFPSDDYPNSDLDGYHDFFEIEFFTAGSGIHYINALPFTVSSGYVFLIRPPDYHHYELSSESLARRYNLKFRESDLYPDVLEMLGSCRRPYSMILAEPWMTRMCHEMELLHILEQEQPRNELLRRSALNRICILLGSALTSFAQTDVLPSIRPTSDARLRRLLDYIGENCHRDLSLADAARFVGLTESYFGSFFHRHIGMHFGEYLRRVRLNLGAELLMTTGMSIKEIAYRVGFHSPEYFTREFRRFFKATPMAYRSKNTGT